MDLLMFSICDYMWAVFLAVYYACLNTYMKCHSFCIGFLGGKNNTENLKGPSKRTM